MDTSSTGNRQQHTRITSVEEFLRLLPEALSDPSLDTEMHKPEIVQELHRIGLCCNHQTDLRDCRTRRPKYTSQRRRAVLQATRPIELKLPQKLARQKAEADSQRYLAESPIALSQLLRNDGPMLHNELDASGNYKAYSMAEKMFHLSNQQPHQHQELLAESDVNKLGFSNQNTASTEQQVRRQDLSEELSKMFPKAYKRLGYTRVLILPEPAPAKSGSPTEWSITVTKLEFVAFEMYAAEVDRETSMFLVVQSQSYPPTGKDAPAISGAIEGHSERAKQYKDHSYRSEHNLLSNANIEATSVARINKIFDTLPGLIEHVQKASTWMVCCISFSHQAMNNASHIASNTTKVMPVTMAPYTGLLKRENSITPERLSQSTMMAFWKNEG